MTTGTAIVLFVASQGMMLAVILYCYFSNKGRIENTQITLTKTRDRLENLNWSVKQGKHDSVKDYRLLRDSIKSIVSDVHLIMAYDGRKFEDTPEQRNIVEVENGD